MTTLNTIIEEEKNRFDQEFAHCKPVNEHTTGYLDSRDYRDIKTFLTTAMKRAYEAGRAEIAEEMKEQSTQPMQLEWYLPLVKAWDKTYDKAFQDGYSRAMHDLDTILSKITHKTEV